MLGDGANESGVPSWLSVQALRLSGGRPGLLVMILSMLAGVISMFVDNVVTILMMAPVALPLARALKIPAVPLVLMIGFSANFMGTALLLGDLPPQMLHSVSGAEFRDFIWQHGRPSSFPILMVTFIITQGFMYWYGFRTTGKRVSVSEAGIKASIPDPLFATITVGMFLLTVVGMAFREVLNVKLGFIAMTGAVMLVLILETMGKRLKAPKFEEVIQELDWRACALCRPDHRREGRGTQGVAGRVPEMERGVHAGRIRRVLRARDADLGVALREVENSFNARSRHDKAKDQT